MTSEDPPPAVVLDANVLIPNALRDTLLRGAEAGWYEVSWSDKTLAEVERNLVRLLVRCYPDADARARRMILPLRGLGSSPTKFSSPITATRPSLRRTVTSPQSRSRPWKARDQPPSGCRASGLMSPARWPRRRQAARYASIAPSRPSSPGSIRKTRRAPSWPRSRQ